jgi:Domain of unknown function (DUF6456)
MSETGAASTLELLHQRKDGAGAPWIGRAARLAGERLAGDLLTAGMLPRVTMDWSRRDAVDGGGSGLNPSEAALAARQRAERALAAVGPDFSGLLIDICGFDKGLATVEAERRWPVRSAKLAARLALNALARHYGYDEVATGRATGMRNWTAPGPRPRVARA